MTYTCTRKLEFDAAHRVERHGGKCSNLHGHRYTVEITCASPRLDEVGVVVDFGQVKAVVGAWIDANLDHTTLYDAADADMAALALTCKLRGMRPWYALHAPPTAEALAAHLYERAQELLGAEIRVVKVRVYETPNCWADYPEAP